MFGYIIPNKRELKLREVEEYRGWYCGLCHCLQRDYGFRGRVTLNYDMTFLSLLLSSLYDDSFQETSSHCLIHPFRKHRRFEGEHVEYCAAMNVLLTYYKCMDDWQDDHNLLKGGFGASLHAMVRKVSQRYPRQTKAVEECLGRLQQAEREGEQDLDQVSGLFGRLCGEIFARERDIWYDDLWHLGFFLGKFIYLLDAWDDLERDAKVGGYNPLLYLRGEETAVGISPDFEGWKDADCDRTTLRAGRETKVREILTGMMGEACRYFERLPIVEYSGILRNILYSGVWTKFVTIHSMTEER